MTMSDPSKNLLADDAAARRVVEKERLAPAIVRMVVNAPLVARKAKPGQFVMVRVDDVGERIPLTIAGADPARGTVTLIFQEVGTTTVKLGRVAVGQSIATLAGPLGRPVEIERFGTVCIVAGGVGAAFVFWMAQAFKEAENRLITILGARTKELLILEEELQGVSDRLFVTTDDGSAGEKGFVTDALDRLLSSGERVDRVITAGPVPMMKRVAEVTKRFGVSTISSLNPIMVDGTGMCGCCRVTVGGKVLFACVDGPDFDAHLVDFDELARRITTYRKQEEESLHRCRLEGVG